MLADPKAAAFAQSFPRQWLQLRKVGMFPPDKGLYPEYDDNLEQSMIAETVGFFGEVLRTQRQPARVSRLRLDDAQRTPRRPLRHRGSSRRPASARGVETRGPSRRTADARLGPQPHVRWHAASPGASRRVGAGVDHRQAAATAAGQRSAARHAGARSAEDDRARRSWNCIAPIPTAPPAISKIDPLGIAFDNYDAIGRWRTVETSTTAPAPIRSSIPAADCPMAATFSDAEELRQAPARRHRQVRRRLHARSSPPTPCAAA